MSTQVSLYSYPLSWQTYSVHIGMRLSEMVITMRLQCEPVFDPSQFVKADDSKSRYRYGRLLRPDCCCVCLSAGVDDELMLRFQLSITTSMKR
jgi:hypothetical protein